MGVPDEYHYLFEDDTPHSVFEDTKRRMAELEAAFPVFSIALNQAETAEREAGDAFRMKMHLC